MSLPYASQVVAKQSFLAQTTILPLMTLFTAPETGDYLMSVYVTQSVSAPYTDTVSGRVYWADEYAEATGWFFETNPGPAGTPVFSVHLPAGNSVQIQTTQGGSTTYPYDLFVTVIQL